MVLIFAVNQIFSIVCAAVAVVAATTLACIYLPMLRRLRRALHGASDEGIASGKQTMPVSVVVYTYANSAGLAEVIEGLKSQDYDAPTEIIVVNDGKDNGVNDFLTVAEMSCPNLRGTFTPHDTRNISRKKLAITLGIKAARYPVVLLLTSESRLPGPHWLASMAAPFGDDRVDMVLGYAGPGEKDVAHGLIGRGLRHDILLSDIEWMSDAIGGCPWRGDGDNIGIRRSMFFERMGFGNSLNLQYGDDDVFVSEVATGDNVAAVFTAQSRVTTEAPADMPKYYLAKRERHAMMNAYCTRRPSMRIILSSVLPWVWLLSTLAACVPALWNIRKDFTVEDMIVTYSMLGILMVTAVAVWLLFGVAFNKVSISLADRPLRWSVPHMLLSRLLRCRGWRRHKAPRSWQQPR
ncbi:glycosyltransferase [uncultured Muribaculum sp.]|uniref:glycosyltransferase n=1 Tax=uncultured Muribaculum sp. TaxID=1918613 RepID=UPI0025F69A61|nr:glycosyltransferase [uncultured Muribaculum sp.]